MNNALLVIDVQESFRARPLWRAVSNPDLVNQVDVLVRHARDRGDLVVWVLHAEPQTGGVFDPVKGHVKVMAEFTPADGEPVLTKTALNAFNTTNLQQRLTAAGIRSLTVCGLRTEMCCETTARIGSDRGLDVNFVIDATATFPIPHRSAPENLSVGGLLAHPLTLSTLDIVERTEYALHGRFGTVTTVKELTGS